MIDWLYFFHIVGIIIALGAVTVIDTLGFLGRNSAKWTQTTIQAHFVTKPLIWLGTIIVVVMWLFMLAMEQWDGLFGLKSLLLLLLVINGAFLSFYISPRLIERQYLYATLPARLQRLIVVSMLISFVSWWTVVFLTVAL
ncbi:MAG: hypothetical protein ACMXYF_05300 [Candidatus Woesearchaeota archaeon]